MSTPRRGTAKPPGKLRIIGGDFRRRMLPVLDHPGLRPTPDRVRETLFNWLGQALHGKQVLDLFAGTGALGIESLSRGAAQVTFVGAIHVAALIRDNLATLGATQGQVVTADAQAFLEKLANLIWCFSTRRSTGVSRVLCPLEAGRWLASDAMIYLETNRA